MCPWRISIRSDETDRRIRSKNREIVWKYEGDALDSSTVQNQNTDPDHFHHERRGRHFRYEQREMLETTATEIRDSKSKEDCDLDSVHRKSRGALFAKRKFSQSYDTTWWNFCTSRSLETKGKKKLWDRRKFIREFASCWPSKSAVIQIGDSRYK